MPPWEGCDIDRMNWFKCGGILEEDFTNKKSNQLRGYDLVQLNVTSPWIVGNWPIKFVLRLSFPVLVKTLVKKKKQSHRIRHNCLIIKVARGRVAHPVGLASTLGGALQLKAFCSLHSQMDFPHLSLLKQAFTVQMRKALQTLSERLLFVARGRLELPTSWLWIMGNPKRHLVKIAQTANTLSTSPLGRGNISMRQNNPGPYHVFQHFPQN